jgi:nicotinamide riboside transporter PnuC
MGMPMNAVPSFWLSIMTFFYGYLFMNAYGLYTQDPAEGGKQVQVKARQFKAATSMAILLVLLIGTVWLRFATSNCETSLGVLLSTSTGVGLAYGWYSFMTRCGLGRLEDVFGVMSRIVPVRQDVTACVPTS